MEEVKSLADLEILSMQIEGCRIPKNVEMHITDEELYKDVISMHPSILTEAGLFPTIQMEQAGVKFIIKHK